MQSIGARGTRAFRWNPTHWSIGPFLLWLIAMATLLLIRIIIKDANAYASTVGFVVPLLDLMFILGSVLSVLMSGNELRDLGLTRKYLLLALAAGLLVGFAIIGVRSLDPRYAGYVQAKSELIPIITFIIGGAYHAFAEEILFRGFFVGRLSRDFGWVPAIIISGIAYGLMPFAFLGADPTSPAQIEEIGRFFGSVFPAMMLLGIMLALVYRIIGNLLTTWFGVALSIWVLGFIRGGILEYTSYPYFALVGYASLSILAIIGIRLLMKAYGREPIGIKEIKEMVE